MAPFLYTIYRNSESKQKIKTIHRIFPDLITQSFVHILDPDQIAPATSLWTHRRDGAVNLRIEKEGPANAKPMSIPTLLVNTVKRNANGTAIGKGFVWSFSVMF